jgi:hypothetical protein
LAASVTNADFPGTISEIINGHNGNASDKPTILAAQKEIWSMQAYPADADITFNQNRFFDSLSYSWKGGTFNSDLWTNTQWQFISRLARLGENFLPINSVNDITGLSSVNFYQPISGSLSGTIVNSKPEECGLLTGDADDFIMSYERVQDGTDENQESVEDVVLKPDAYFNKEYGWERGASNNSGMNAKSMIEASSQLFGTKCIHVVNAKGPSNVFRMYNNKKYFVSCWVKVNSGTLKIATQKRKLLNPATEPGWPITKEKLSDVSYGDKSTSFTSSNNSDWQFVILTIDPVTDPEIYLRLEIGNADGSVDANISDIRFFPIGALVNTCYHDTQTGLLSASVDANNKVSYFKYDNAGRLIEQGIVRKN